MANLTHTPSSRQFVEGDSQGTPPAGVWELFFDADGPHAKDDAGVVYDLIAAGTGGAAVEYKALAADFVTSSLTFVDVDNGGGDDLIFNLEANTAYLFEVIARAESNATTDAVEVGINGPASPNSVVGTIHLNANAYTIQYLFDISSYDEEIVSGNGPGSTTAALRCSFFVSNGPNAGDLAFRLRSEVGNTSTLLAGAVMTKTTLALSSDTAGGGGGGGVDPLAVTTEDGEAILTEDGQEILVEG